MTWSFSIANINGHRAIPVKQLARRSLARFGYKSNVIQQRWGMELVG